MITNNQLSAHVWPVQSISKVSIQHLAWFSPWQRNFPKLDFKLGGGPCISLLAFAFALAYLGQADAFFAMGAVTLGVVVVVGVGGLGFVWSEWVGAFFFELSSLRGVKEAGVEVGGGGGGGLGSGRLLGVLVARLFRRLTFTHLRTLTRRFIEATNTLPLQQNSQPNNTKGASLNVLQNSKLPENHIWDTGNKPTCHLCGPFIWHSLYPKCII